VYLSKIQIILFMKGKFAKKKRGLGHDEILKNIELAIVIFLSYEDLICLIISKGWK